MTMLLLAALGLLLQSTILLLLGLIALRLAWSRGPAVGTLIGRATLVGVALALLLAGPLTGHIRPLWHISLPVSPPAPNPGGEGSTLAPLASPPIPPSVPLSSPAPPELGAGGRSLPSPALSPAPSPLPDGPTPVPWPSPLPRLYAALTVFWGAGAAALLLWLCVCQWHLTRLRRASRPLTSGPAAEMLADLTPRPPLLRTHPAIRSPFLAGIRRPAIFLPAAYDTEFDPPALRAILAHELAHLARRDNAWTLAARLLCALLWPQPLLWVLCRRLEQIGEEACDQAVLAQNCPPRAYADCLLTLAERHPLGRRERALGAGVTPFRSSLGRRVQRILDKGTHAMPVVSNRQRLTIAALTIAAALGGAFLISSAPAQSSEADALASATLALQQYKASRTKDLSNLHEIGLAVGQYVQDNKGHYPDADHWMDQLYPYIADKTILFDPFQSGQHYGYAFNRNCSKKPIFMFKKPWKTVVVFDSTRGTRNASDTGVSLRVIKLPSDKHLNSGSGFAFADGHCKWYSNGSRPSFSLKGGADLLPGTTPSEAPVPNDLAASVVRKYLDARAAGRYADAYALLSPDTQEHLTFTEFQKANNDTTQRLQRLDAHAPLLKAMGGLFYDTHSILGYRYQVVETAPEDERRKDLNLVLVSVQGPGLPAEGAVLKIAANSETGGAPRLDAGGTYSIAPPATFNHAGAKVVDVHCDMNIKQIGFAIWDYAYHHNDRFPDANRWMDEIKPYLKDEGYLHDPAAPDSETYSYAYNRNLSGVASDRVSNMGGTVMLFESSLNVRNANDTGQSLVEPSRHPGHHNFMCVGTDREVKEGQSLPFAVHIAPPGYFATASVAELIKSRDRAKAQFADWKRSFTTSDQKFEKALRVLLPQANAQKIAAVRALELKIGLPEMSLQSIQHLRTTGVHGEPGGGQPDWNHLEALSEAKLRPLLAQEAGLLPAVPKPQIARLHTLAASRTQWDFLVGGFQSQIDHYNNVIQRRQQQTAGH